MHTLCTLRLRDVQCSTVIMTVVDSLGYAKLKTPQLVCTPSSTLMYTYTCAVMYMYYMYCRYPLGGVKMPLVYPWFQERYGLDINQTSYSQVLILINESKCVSSRTNPNLGEAIPVFSQAHPCKTQSHLGA